MSMGTLYRGLAALLVGTAALEVLRTAVGALCVAGALPEVAGLLGYGSLGTLSFFASMALFFGLSAFTWRAASNVKAWEPDFYESPGGAAVSWLVPGWNLYKPYDALCSVWSGTAQVLPGDEPRGPTRIVEAFWGAWVLSIVVGRLFGGGAGDAWIGVGDVAAAGLSAVACALGAVVVLRMGRLQEEAGALGELAVT